jgi:hypothetical protein
VAIIPTGSEELCKDSRKEGMRLRNLLLSVGVCAAALVALSGSVFAAGDAVKGKVGLREMRNLSSGRS